MSTSIRAACIRRQDRRRKADALGAFARAVAHPWAAHRDRTDAGHDFALGQMPVAHQPLAAVISEFVGMAAEQGGNLRLDGLRQQRSRAIAQYLGQRIGECPWLGELENISLGHGVSSNLSRDRASCLAYKRGGEVWGRPVSVSLLVRFRPTHAPAPVARIPVWPGPHAMRSPLAWISEGA